MSALGLVTRGLSPGSGLSIATRGLIVRELGATDPAPPGSDLERMVDAALRFDDGALVGDLAVEAGDLAVEHGLRTAVVLSLFCDRLAEADDRLPDRGEDRRGWWADAYPEVEGDRLGSRLWLLAREKHTRETLLRAREYAREALAWLEEDGVAERVEVEAEWLRRGVLALGVRIQRPADPASEFRFAIAWEAV